MFVCVNVLVNLRVCLFVYINICKGISVSVCLVCKYLDIPTVDTNKEKKTNTSTNNEDRRKRLIVAT